MEGPARVQAAELKRRGNYSPVICFETGDPKRLWQLKEFLCERGEVLVYDPWMGLGRLDAGCRFQAARRSSEGTALERTFARGEGGEVRHLKSALREVDPILKERRVSFIIQNLHENREWETGLCSALRAWAIDPAVITTGSSVYLVTPDVTSLLDPATRDLVVIIPVDPSADWERRNTIIDLARELELDVTERVASLVAATSGLNLHQLESVLLEAYYRSGTFDLTDIKVLKSELVKQSGVLEVKDPVYTFADIGGYDAVKSFVRRYIVNVLKEPERARSFGVPLPRGVLFFGPPGTGKSLFAHALASEVNLPFINLLTENIYSKWLGESGHRMRDALRLVDKMSPAVVFIDEIDRFGKRGRVGDSAGEETSRVFSQFLEWLGRPERESIIVGTTNVPSLLDEAFLRAGRLDYKIPFLYPGPQARLSILRVHLGLVEGARTPRPPLEGDLEEALVQEVVPRTAGFSGAELAELVTRARRIAFDRRARAVTAVHLLEAVGTFRVDRAERARAVQRYMAQARKFTDDAQFLRELGDELEGEDGGL